MEGIFLKGVWAGALSGAIKDIPSFFLHNILKITDTSFWDYANIIAAGRHPNGLIEQVYSFFLEIIFSITVGIIYLFIIPYLKTEHKLMRGAIYGGIVWFVIRAWVAAFHIGPLHSENTLTMVVNSVLSIFFGVGLELMLKVIHLPPDEQK